MSLNSILLLMRSISYHFSVHLISAYRNLFQKDVTFLIRQCKMSYRSVSDRHKIYRSPRYRLRSLGILDGQSDIRICISIEYI